MTMQEQIEILMDDGCTKSEAEKHLKNGSTVYYDLEENLDKYLADWSYLDDGVGGVKYTDSVRKMVRTGEPLTDWGIVKKNGKNYYIEYVL